MTKEKKEFIEATAKEIVSDLYEKEKNGIEFSMPAMPVDYFVKQGYSIWYFDSTFWKKYHRSSKIADRAYYQECAEKEIFIHNN